MNDSLFSKLLIAWILMALCVTIHCVGLALAFRFVKRSARSMEGHFWHATFRLIGIAGWTLGLHLLQIAVWAFYFAAKGAMPDLASAFYFSAVTYTTTGYGDLVLPQEWRLVGGVEALTGILMCGLSTGFFFAVLARIVSPKLTSNSEKQT